MTDRNRPSWDDLQREHAPAVWSVVYRILANYEDARDCYQEIFLEAFRSLRQDEVENWAGFFRWLATRRAIDMLRQRRRRSTEPLMFEPTGPSGKCDIEHADTVEVIQRELALMVESQAMAFWLFSVEQMSHAEIATQMKSTTNAVALLVHRARTHLKSRLRNLIEERLEK